MQSRTRRSQRSSSRSGRTGPLCPQPDNRDDGALTQVTPGHRETCCTASAPEPPWRDGALGCIVPGCREPHRMTQWGQRSRRSVEAEAGDRDDSTRVGPMTSERNPHVAQETERAVLAGGCFWGMQDLIRKMPGVISTRVGYTGGDVPNATYRNHRGHAEAIEIVFDPSVLSYRNFSSSSFRSTTPRRRTARATTSARATAPPSSTRATRSAWSPRTPSPTSMPRASGPDQSSPRSNRREPSGRPNRSTRITSRSIRTATPAISFAPGGSCRAAGPRSSTDIQGLGRRDSVVTPGRRAAVDRPLMVRRRG